MHDAKGRLLVEGDVVLVPFKVTTVSPGPEYCNLSLISVATMYPGNSPSFLTVNSKQVLKVNTNPDVACGPETGEVMTFDTIDDGGGKISIR